MATALTPRPETPAPPARGFRPHRMSVDRYCRLVAAGVYDAKDPVFLWKGQLVETMTKGRPHQIAVVETHAALFRLLPAGWHVQSEQPIVLGDDSVPEPDAAVVRGVPRDYADRPPGAGDVALVVEVTDSPVAVDAGKVLEAYAANAIPCYWLVNIPARRVEVYRRPEGPRYAERTDHGADDAVPLVLDGREVGRVAVRDLLP